MPIPSFEVIQHTDVQTKVKIIWVKFPKKQFS